MNPHLKQLWAAMRLPENFKKSYKFFCRGLDIRVSEVVKPDVLRADGLQDLLMGVAEGVRVEHGAGLGRHEQVGTVGGALCAPLPAAPPPAAGWPVCGWS